MAVVLGLELLARRVRMPPAAAFILGGIALALIPGTPDIELDPDLALVLFLPPLLLASAYFTVWRDFRANLRIILQLAVGAVAFTTLVVGVVAHWVEPSLPWAACFALGAIVSPPDAVAAKAVLERLSLPPRITVLLEGESLVNDASGLVLYRFAVVAALTGTFDAGQAAVSFAFLAAGGVAAGVAFGWLVTLLLGRLRDPTLSIIASFLAAWVAYIFGEALHVSGVLATVACGLVMGWRQHTVLSAVTRIQALAVWNVSVFILEFPDLHPDRVVATWCAPSIGGKLACDRKSAALGGRHHHRGYLDAFPLDLPSDLSAARFDTGVAPPRPISASGGPDRDELGRHAWGREFLLQLWRCRMVFPAATSSWRPRSRSSWSPFWFKVQPWRLSSAPWASAGSSCNDRRRCRRRKPEPAWQRHNWPRLRDNLPVLTKGSAIRASSSNTAIAPGRQPASTRQLAA